MNRMKKRYILPIVTLILAFAYFMFLSTYKDNFQQEPLYDWMQVGALSFLIYITLSLFLRNKWRLFIYIPGFLYVGFMISFLINVWNYEYAQDPFSHYSIIYASLLVYFLLIALDALKHEFAGIKLFFTVILSTLLIYGFVNFYYLAYTIQPDVLLNDYNFEAFLIFIIFISPYFVILCSMIYQTLSKEEPVKEVEPYNRYRPDIKVSQEEPEKSAYQTQREKNAIRGLTLLHDAGLLSDDEFERKKNRVLSGK